MILSIVVYGPDWSHFVGVSVRFVVVVWLDLGGVTNL